MKKRTYKIIATLAVTFCMFCCCFTDLGIAEETDATMLYSDDKNCVELLLPINYTDSVIVISLRYTYSNQNDSLEFSSFNDIFRVLLFQNDISCASKYIDNYYNLPNAATYIRNGQSITFDLAFSVDPESTEYQMVLIPIETTETKDYVTYDITRPITADN